MLKVLLLLLVLMSCAGVGRTLSRMRRQRSEQLGEILAAMRVLRLRMLNTAEPLGVLMRKSDSGLFRNIGNSLWEGAGLNECWLDMRAGQAQLASINALNSEDMLILDGFFRGLGSSGRDEQNALFGEVIARMEEAQTQAHKRYQDTARVYTALGTLVGIGICILIA